MASNYDLLLAKINEFTRKFYLNKMIRGCIYAASSILLLFLLLFVTVYYAQPTVNTKTFLFFLFIFFAIACISFWIIKPALSFFKLGKTLSMEQASTLIGNHFFNVKDRLLNTLQLHALASSSSQNNQLILAGIDQKINELKPIPFSNAINLGDNKKYIKFIALPLLIIFLIGIIAPAILRDGTNSFIKYNQEILPKAPFDFVLLNKNLTIMQGDDLTLSLKLTGNEFPQDIYLEDGINTYKLEKKNISNFIYKLTNVQQNKSLRFIGGGFYSKTITVFVKPRPSLLSINAMLVFPNYLRRKSEQINNVSDLLIPEGTKINWQLSAANASEIDFILQNLSHHLTVAGNKAFFSSTLKKNSTYRVVPKNDYVANADSISHQINVVADQYPTISVTETADSLSSRAFYFTGNITDDYGFSALKFKYQIKKDGKIIAAQNKSIPIKYNQTENTFFYVWNLNQVNVKPGEILEYFFEVADNDGVNGAKTARSEIKTQQVPTQQQIAKNMAQGSDELKKKMESTIKLAQSIEKESKKLNQSLLDKKQITFEDKKQIEQLLDKQKKLDEAINDIKKQNEKNNFNKEENKTLNDELKEKQKQIDDLFNNALDEKTKDLLKKLQQLMEMNNKEMTQNQLQKMQMDNKSLKNELDRILELYKQLEFEQSLQNKIDRLKEMAQQQKELSQQSKDQKSNINNIKSKQDELNKDFKELQKELKELAQKNQQLDKPNAFNNPEKQSKEIEQKQQQSKEQLDKNNKKEAAQEQQQAGEEMEKMASQMSDEQQEGQEQENKINAKELRKLLENLLSTSFTQEKVMLATRKMSNNDPSYVSNAQQQNVIKDNMKTIADSLFSLSKRVPEIQSTVNTELDKINLNMGKTLESLAERRTAEANRTQQYAMTSMNNLALMLNEALEQLQKNQKKGGKGKGKKQSMQQLQQMQEQLNKKMQQAKEQLEKDGNKGTVPKGQMSQEFAKMAQQQQMIREALEKINKEDNKDGKGSMGNLNQSIQDMKKTEFDLVNKKIIDETLKRQKELMVKLLDADKAQREQDEDAKRESNAAKEFPPQYKQMLEKYNKQYKTESELIQKLPPNLNYYYKNKIAEYFKLLNSNKN